MLDTPCTDFDATQESARRTTPSTLSKADTLPIEDIDTSQFVSKSISPTAKVARKLRLGGDDSGLGSSLTTPFMDVWEHDSGVSSQEQSTIVHDTETNAAPSSVVTPSPSPNLMSIKNSYSSGISPKRAHTSPNKHDSGYNHKYRSKHLSSWESVAPTQLNNGATGYVDSCVVCLSKPKEASIIHGKTGHQVCCYVCAKRLKRRGKSCPVCRRPITKVIKNYLI